MTKDVKKKPRYQPPVMMPLDAVKSAAGECVEGSGDVEACGLGSSAIPACLPGTAADPVCDSGSLATEY